MSGIDKLFDYLVPHDLEQRAQIGARVRVNLNGRRVSGWIVDVAPHGSVATHLSLDKLAPIVGVSGAGVEQSLVSLTQWVAREWFGAWRAVLNSASAPRMRLKNAHERHGSVTLDASEPVIAATNKLLESGGGLLVVPPALSALQSVVASASRGPVLVICPTVRMASLGAAALRRRGLTTAFVPDEWESAQAGVDVVIGARSAVFAPCRNISCIVVIDEHDESLNEERAPSWNAVDVARERAHLQDVPLVLTSSVPSAASLRSCADATTYVTSSTGWPRVSVVDLAEVPVAQSLLTSELLSAVQNRNETTVCVLNTKGKARLIACKACRSIQVCSACNALLTQNDNGVLVCERCSVEHGSVCGSCGRSSFVVPRGGVTQLRTQLQASTTSPIVEITSDSDDSWTQGNVFIGTEAVLYRVPSANTIVFADIDRDLSAPRVTAPSEVLALVARAARVVGSHGRVIIQTRQPSHPLMQAMASSDIQKSLQQFAERDLTQRQLLNMPPFVRMVRLTLGDKHSLFDVDGLSDVQVADLGDSYLARSTSRAAIAHMVAQVRATFGTSVRVHADPARY